ncbi:MAG: hypothetical protein ABIF92_00980 [archaeon]
MKTVNYNKVVLLVTVAVAVLFIVGFVATMEEPAPTGHIILTRLSIIKSYDLTTPLSGGGKMTVPVSTQVDDSSLVTTESGGGKM